MIAQGESPGIGPDKVFDRIDRGVEAVAAGWAVEVEQRLGSKVFGASYDAVVNFGAIHHVVRWRQAIGEIARVLKPGGAFYCAEILSRYITHPLLGRLMDHPQADRFDRPQFILAFAPTWPTHLR